MLDVNGLRPAMFSLIILCSGFGYSEARSQGTDNARHSTICIDARSGERCSNGSLPQFIGFPKDPDLAVKKAISENDPRLAGWGGYGAQYAGAPYTFSLGPFGIKCSRKLERSAFRYAYIISTAIDRDAMAGYKEQKSFMARYNQSLFRRGLIPKSFGCKV